MVQGCRCALKTKSGGCSGGSLFDAFRLRSRPGGVTEVEATFVLHASLRRGSFGLLCSGDK